MDAIERLKTALADRYRIERELGTGGMATVYLAEDLKHDRKVAVKVLKPELAAVLGAERFVVEIKTTAALQHPHILPLFDSGTADGFLFYVMPFIDGETLRSKLDRETQFGVDEAVRIAVAVADALDYAHRHGVIHRDIKPENILLHEGRPMVADFGIALAVSAAAGGRMTETGLSLGTPHYMSPEQATAEKEISARSDVYSLASVLFEMLAGQPPHLGGSAQQIIMKIITETAPSVTTLRKSVPLHVAAAVAKSLEKLPADRFESAKAFGDALGNVGFGGGALASAAISAGAPTARRRLPLALAAVGLVSLTALATWIIASRRDTGGGSVHLALSSSLGQPLGTVSGRSVAISPDGRTIVYATADSTGRARLYVRRLNALSQAPVPGVDRAAYPFFSPDGASVAYTDGRQLKQVDLSGGTPSVLADITGVFQGATWTADGIVAAINGVLMIVPSTGGVPTPFVSGDTVHGYWPVALPGGKTVAFMTKITTTAPIAVLDLRTRRATTLDVVGPVVGAINDNLLYLRGGALLAVPFDPSGPRVTGTGREVLPEVQMSVLSQPKAAVSASGSIVFVTGSNVVQAVLVDVRGAARPLPIPAARLQAPRFSPDGRRVVAEVAAPGRSDVWIYDLALGTSQRMTSDGTGNGRADWSPDGTRILFRTIRGTANASFWWQPSDGSGSASELVAFAGRDLWQAQLTPDVGTVVFRAGTLGNADIYYRHLKGDTATKPIAATKFDEVGPRLSPDGRWVAYATDEAGAYEVVVRPFPGPGAQFAVSAGGGSTPMWSRDGRRIVYANGTQIVEATVATTPAFSVTSRRVLFQGDFYMRSAHAMFDLSRDGASLLMLRNVPGSTEQIVVIHNWQAELKAKAKAGATP